MKAEDSAVFALRELQAMEAERARALDEARRVQAKALEAEEAEALRRADAEREAQAQRAAARLRAEYEAQQQARVRIAQAQTRARAEAEARLAQVQRELDRRVAAAHSPYPWRLAGVATLGVAALVALVGFAVRPPDSPPPPAATTQAVDAWATVARLDAQLERLEAERAREQALRDEAQVQAATREPSEPEVEPTPSIRANTKRPRRPRKPRPKPAPTADKPPKRPPIAIDYDPSDPLAGLKRRKD